MRRRHTLAIITVAIGGLLGSGIALAQLAQAGSRGTPANPAAQSRIDQLNRHAVADAKALATPRYDGKAKLPQPPPHSSGKAAPLAERCFTPRSTPAGAKHYKACVRDNPDRKPAVADLSGIHADAVPQDEVLPLPEWCALSSTLKQWVEYRKQACFIASKKAVILDADTGAVTDVIDYDILDYEYTSDVLETWGRQLVIKVFDITGIHDPTKTTVDGAALCTGSCGLDLSAYPEQPASPGSLSVGHAFFDTTISLSGSRGTADTTFIYSFLNPGWVAIPLFADAPPSVRCDNDLPETTQIGCVFPIYTPIHQYSLDGEFPELARHVRDAQASGLPGGYPNGPTLNRLADATRKESNRTRACPLASNGGYPRPPDKSCDEYPMASTYQGAATANPQGRARTFDWCKINEPPGTGPVGYSVCMIDAKQNSLGGSDLGSTYRTERVLDNDPFYVWITGTGGGGNPNPPDFPPVVNAGPDVSGFEGDRVDMAGTATDPEGDPLTYRWTYSTGPDVDPGTVCFFGDATSPATTIRCTDDGTVTVTLSVADPYHDEPSVDSAVVHLVNVSPRIRRNAGNNAAAVPKAGADPVLGIVAPAPWQLFRVGDPVTLTTNYFDPGSNDTQTCAVRWDDGSTTSSAGTGTVCSGTHRYTHAGMYTIKPVITDDDGGVSDATSVMVIVYDPAAGVARGNGWLNAGGDGGFDFTASYPLRAATVPDGAVTFALPPSLNLNLRNHQHLDWLVVTPDGKIAIKGTAERIPGQNVGFVLYGYYGCPAGQTTGCQPGPNRLRMVVWDSTAHGPIPDGVPLLYDNRSGRSFDVDKADPQTVNQGTILIQHPPIG